jgi:hypothetical protein
VHCFDGIVKDLKIVLISHRRPTQIFLPSFVKTPAAYSEMQDFEH